MAGGGGAFWGGGGRIPGEAEANLEKERGGGTPGRGTKGAPRGE